MLFVIIKAFIHTIVHKVKVVMAKVCFLSLFLNIHLQNVFLYDINNTLLI